MSTDAPPPREQRPGSGKDGGAAAGRVGRARSRGVVLPLLLIAVGVVLLLDALDVVAGDVWWSLLRLWPVVLIAIGLDLIVGRASTGARLAVGAVTALLFAGGAVVVLTIDPQPPTVVPVSEALDGEDAATVELDVAVGGLRLAGGADRGVLLDGSVAVPAGRDLEVSRSEEDGRLRLELRTDGGFPFLDLGRSRGEDGPPWDLRLGDDVDLTLSISTGVGESTIDLRGLSVTELDVDTGVGESTVTLPAAGRIRASIDTGIGAVTVRIPRGMDISISADAGIGDVSVEGPWERQDDRWVSDGFSDADDRVELEIDGGIGEIRVEQAS